MRKPDDDLKLDINEIFGGDWTEPSKTAPEPVVPEPPASVLPETMEDIQGSNIKFNDEVNAPIVEPVVITVIQKVKRYAQAPEVEAPIEAPIEEAPKLTTDAAIQTLQIVQPGTSGRSDTVSSEPSSIVMKPGVSARKEPTLEDFINAYDRFRLIFIEELKGTIDVRRISTMFVKTFEAARERNLDILRNANWDSAGNLIEDGSLNVQRISDNKNALDEKQSEVILDNALLGLFNLRIQAVEKGLGPEYGTRVKAQIRKWIDTEMKKNGSGKNDPKVLQRLSNFLL
jgi:hypothetical protein